MITIDPNLRGCGVAEWRGSQLIRAGYVKNPVTKGRGYVAHAAMGEAVHGCVLFLGTVVIIEHPRAYGSVHREGDPNDLLDVVGVGAAIATKCNTIVESVFPSDWKGNVPKQKMLVRIWDKLTEEERAVVQKTNKSDREDVLDAIGIGLWKLNRLNKRNFNNE